MDLCVCETALQCVSSIRVAVFASTLYAREKIAFSTYAIKRIFLKYVQVVFDFEGILKSARSMCREMYPYPSSLLPLPGVIQMLYRWVQIPGKLFISITAFLSRIPI